MSRSSEYPGHRQQGWDTTSRDYHAHVAKILRTPSVLPGVPQYPNVHRIFNNRSNYQEEQEVQYEQPTPETHRKVQFIETEERFERDKNGDAVIYEESVDVESDAYAQQKRRGFELCKWKTFRTH